MFTKAHLKLTIFYSLLFFVFFWSFSFGLYIWVGHSLGENYISQVKKLHEQTGQNIGEFDDSKVTIVTIAGEVVLDRLANILIIFNAGLLLIIPVTSCFFARRSLSPIKQAHEQQKQFVSDASHELRTPLTIMLGELEVALQKQRSNKNYQQILLSNKEELNRLSTLVENLLFLAREDQNKNDLQFVTVDITDIVSSVIAHLNSEIKKKRLEIMFKPPEENIAVYANTSLLTQLFFNIIDNAIKYTPAKGIITVSLVKKNKIVEITVKDTGIGITPNIQEKIFERFYRVDSSRSLSRGYGLGLPICRVIVKRHQGNLTLHSAEGKGSAFVISLPVVSAKSAK
jgi:signal transduction histidine kinase